MISAMLSLSDRILSVQDKNNPTRPAGMPQTERRFVKFGGGLSMEQLEWLRVQCSNARQLKQRVILFCHLPLHPETCYNACLLWNYEAVLEIVHDNCDVFVATLAGHAHNVRPVSEYHPLLLTCRESKQRTELCSCVPTIESGYHSLCTTPADALWLGSETYKAGLTLRADK